MEFFLKEYCIWYHIVWLFTQRLPSDQKITSLNFYQKESNINKLIRSQMCKYLEVVFFRRKWQNTNVYLSEVFHPLFLRKIGFHENWQSTHVYHSEFFSCFFSERLGCMGNVNTTYPSKLTYFSFCIIVLLGYQILIRYSYLFSTHLVFTIFPWNFLNKSNIRNGRFLYTFSSEHWYLERKV